MAEMKEFAVEVDDLLRMVGKRYGRGAETAPGATLEVQRLLQELQGQKAELELENARLQKTVHDAEGALEKYIGLYNLSPASYLSLDRNGTIRNANLTFAGLMGLPRTGLIGVQFDSFLAHASRDTFASLLKREFAGPGRANCQLTLRNGAAATLLVQVEAATSGDQWLIALVGIAGQIRAKGEQVAGHEADEALPKSPQASLTGPLC